MDELPYFGRMILEALRQPLEEGTVTVARMGAALKFPARFSLIAAANPCPCGMGAGGQCSCSPGRLDQYIGRLSGPLLDRIDVQVEVARLTEDELLAISPGESTAEIRSRVVAARKRREKREDSEPTAEPTIRTLDSSTRTLLKRAFAAEPTSARAFHRTLGVARSIADLEGSENIEEAHVAEALQLRKPVWV